jgi:hypothetical protein
MIRSSYDDVPIPRSKTLRVAPNQNQVGFTAVSIAALRKINMMPIIIIGIDLGAPNPGRLIRRRRCHVIIPSVEGIILGGKVFSTNKRQLLMEILFGECAWLATNSRPHHAVLRRG